MNSKLLVHTLEEICKAMPQNGDLLLINYQYYHYCTQCGGWIHGIPVAEHVDTTGGPLTGRCGQVIHCLRCNYELNFIGYSS